MIRHRIRRGTASGLALCMLLVSLPALPIGAQAPDNTYGTVLSETNTGDMNLVPYNNPDIPSDLKVGLNAIPMVIDMNRDGYMDLVVSDYSVPYDGTFIFYGSASSGDEDSDGFLMMSNGYRMFDGSTYLRGTPLYTESTDEKTGEIRYTYDKTVVMDRNRVYLDFSDPAGRQVYYGQGLDYPTNVGGDSFTSQRDDQYALADVDGDGLLDLIRAIGNWEEYGWDGKYDENGVWGDGDDPLHGWVFWSKNTGTNDYPLFGDPRPITINGDENTPLDVYGSPSPQFYDFDQDGDLDILCGTFVDSLVYFENTGTRTAPVYAPGVPVKNDSGETLRMELCMLNVTSFDWNGDGFLDLIIGEEDGRVSYVENTGSFSEDGSPTFYPARYFRMPSNTLGVGILNTPFSIDWDGDGDEDILCGNSAGFITFIRNLSAEKDVDPADPVWDTPVRITGEDGTPIRHQAGLNGSIQGPAEQKWGYTQLTAADWDGDGVLDLMVNDIWGKVVWYRGIAGETTKVEAAQPVRVDYTGEAVKPAWTWWEPEDNQLVAQWRSTPFMIDLNEDGLTDLVTCDYEGYMAYYEREEQADGLHLKEGQRIFYNASGSPLRFTSGTEGGSGRIDFVLVDYDGDGRLDMIRNDSVNISWYRNIATEDGAFRFENMGSLHTRQLAKHTVHPTACDWNQDGTADLLIGAEDGHFYYLKNNAKEYTVENYGEPDTVRTQDELASSLVAHWDFEGDAPYADKGTGGTVSDALRPQNAVRIEDGAAVVTGSGGLLAADSVDLSPTGEMTILLRMKVSGSLSGYTNFVDKRAFASTPGGEDRAYGLMIQNGLFTTQIAQGKKSPVVFLQSDQKIAADTWQEIALVIREGPKGKRLITIFVSQQAYTLAASDFEAVLSSVSALTSINDSAVDLVVGNDINLGEQKSTRIFDDVRLYDTALSRAEIAQVYPYTEECRLERLESDVDFAFDPAVESYRIPVGSDKESISLTPAVRHPETAVITLTDKSGTKAINSGDTVLIPLDHAGQVVTLRVTDAADPSRYREYRLSIEKEAAEPSLVAHWDFRGDTLSEQLQDKAAAGSDADTLRIDDSRDNAGSVAIQDGVITLTGSGAVFAEDSADLSITGEMTLYFRMKIDEKMTGTAARSLLDKRIFNNTDRSFALFVDKSGLINAFASSNGSARGASVITSSSAYPVGEFREYAYVLKRVEGDVLQASLYRSTGETAASAADFELLAQSTTTLKSVKDGTARFFIGNSVSIEDVPLTRSFAEIRLYTEALAPEELAAIS